MSVEKIEKVTLHFQSGFAVDDHGKRYEKDDIDSLLHTLFVTCDLTNTKDPYKGFLYEDDIQDFNLKFFLVIHYEDCTYFAIKGIHPFKQAHFKEIQEAFQPYLENR